MHKLDHVNCILPLDALVKEYLEILEALLGDDPDLSPDSEHCSHHSTGVGGAWCRSKVHVDGFHNYTRNGGVRG